MVGSSFLCSAENKPLAASFSFNFSKAFCNAPSPVSWALLMIN
jgi:hypothetical protein